MPQSFLTAPDAFTATAGKNAITLQAMSRKDFEAWLKKAPAAVKQRVEQSPFGGKPGQILPLYNDKGVLGTILVAINDPVQLFDLAPVCNYIIGSLPEKTIKATTFKLGGLKGKDAEKACLGWGLAAYRFENYKTEKAATIVPKLVWPEKVDKKSVEAHLESSSLIRNLINIPANDLGPDELEKAARAFATAEGLTIKVIKDKELIKNNFPMIYEVGKGSPRRPRLIDMQWGNAKHKKLTLVGKGVCFDTGGLNLKPGGAMYTMKKDMGGAAHVMGIAMLIIRHKLPVRLRVLIPAVENSVSGESYRPADIINSRKGLTVEVGDTDAEGRLILADTLTLACEDKPEFLIDFATLTGAARIATGMDIPPIFSNNEKIAFKLRDFGAEQEDTLWPLPLYQPYRKDIASSIADLCSTGGKAGAITAALFLESFVDAKTDWVHVDLSAWEEGGKPGRSKGGTEMGSRAVFAYLQDRFGKA